LQTLAKPASVTSKTGKLAFPVFFFLRAEILWQNGFEIRVYRVHIPNS
jgi:hypothetical protein